MKQLKKLDIQEEEIRIWEKMVDLKEVDQFCLDHKIELKHVESNGGISCYIDGDLYSTQFTSFGALYRAIHEYKKECKPSKSIPTLI